LCEVAVGVALLELVDAAAAAVAPTAIAAGTAMAVPVTAAVVTTVAPAAWPPTTAPAAGACATVVAGTTVCATATPVAAMADNRITSLMMDLPESELPGRTVYMVANSLGVTLVRPIPEWQA
jgi:hypothetical protein